MKIIFSLLLFSTFWQAKADEVLIPEGAQVELIQSGYKFTEGAALAPDGRIFFNDIPNNRTHVFDPKTQTVSVHRENTGGANGLMFTADGALLACEGSNRIITIQKGSEIRPLVTAYEGRKLNSPNDVEIDQKGGIYFTDPRYGKTADLEQDKEAVYYVTPDEGKVIRVIDTLKKPNGLALSPDQKILYVADNGTGNVHAFDISSTNTKLSNNRIITSNAPVNDGMKVDERGNLWVTTSEGVKIFDHLGKHLRTIQLPEGPANCVFGAKGSNVLYINARTGFYKIRVNVSGAK